MSCSSHDLPWVFDSVPTISTVIPVGWNDMVGTVLIVIMVFVVLGIINAISGYAMTGNKSDFFGAR
jgi:hypothetical protein